MNTIILIFVVSVACMAQELPDRGTTLEQTLDSPESLEVRLCVDEAVGLVLVISDKFFEKWRKTKSKYYADIRIELPDTIIDLSYNEFVKRITNQEGK